MYVYCPVTLDPMFMLQPEVSVHIPSVLVFCGPYLECSSLLSRQEWVGVGGDQLILKLYSSEHFCYYQFSLLTSPSSGLDSRPAT